MSGRDIENDDPHLNPAELSALRDVIGEPDPIRISQAMDEVAVQVAMEDLALLIIEGLTETARTLIDAVTGIGDVRDDIEPQVSPEKDMP